MESDYTAANVDLNHVPAIIHLDGYIGPVVLRDGQSPGEGAPVNVSSDTLNAISSGTNPTLYDAVGRDFRVGVRCKL